MKKFLQMAAVSVGVLILVPGMVQASEAATKAITLGQDAPLVTHGVDEQAQLGYWQWQHQGLSLRLVQRLPDQTRGFFLARGFSRKAVERIANACVFQTVIRNEGGQTIDYTLSDWSLLHNGKRVSIPTQAYWRQQWQALGESSAAQIAWRWAVFPHQQTLAVGDYFWGMSVYDLPFGERFDLRFTYQAEGQTFHGQFKGVRCAVDEE